MEMKEKKKKKKSHKLLMLLVELIVLLILIVAVFFFRLINKMGFEDFADSEAGINEDLDSETVQVLKGYTNIALFGLDNRKNGSYERGNSDVMMIASIDSKTKEVKLVSVYRDTCLNIGNDVYKKANAAYASGGAKQAVQMLNANMDLNITEYVCVDWAAMVEVIDSLGGLELDITSAEMQQINKYKKDVDLVTGLATPELTKYGPGTHLDGTQATTYARIRKLAGDDFKRASRQRIVLQAMLKKAKAADVATLLEICNKVVDDISTSLSVEEILKLAKDVRSYEIKSTTGFPFALTTATMNRQDTVVPAELINNVSALHQYLFETESYVPSQTVINYSNVIVQKSGVTKESALIKTEEYNETVGAEGTEDLKK